MKRFLLLLLTVLLLAGCSAEPKNWSVTVDGQELASKTVTQNGTVYVRTEEMEAALGVTLEQAQAVTIDGASWHDLYEVCEALDISILEDEEQERFYCTGGILGWEVPEGYSVPVIMYHGVSDDVWGNTDMFLSPADMEDQLRYLVENGYDPIWFEDLAHVADYDKPILLTFDDGYVCNYTTLYPMLQKYNVKVTISIVTSSMSNRPTSMTREMVRELADSGLVSIQSHTINHKTLPQCDRETKEYEIVQSKLEVARITGREPLLLCYPGGGYDDEVLQIAKDHYRFAITGKDITYITGDDPLQIPRYSVYRGKTMEQFIAMLDSVVYVQAG